MVMPAVRILEELAVFTPLGIRFWDPVLDDQIRAGLRVTAWSALGPATNQRRVSAFRTSSDVYAFHHLPGLLAVEYCLPEAAGSPPPRRPFVVQVEDDERHFLPAAIAIDLPLLASGVFPTAGACSSMLAPRGFLLYSNPARPLSSALAAVRGELIEQSTGAPAAHALLRLRVSGEEHYGLADDSGQFALVFPWPPVLGGGGSPSLAGGSLREQRWPVTLAVHYEPARLETLPGTLLPDYCSVLQQAPALLWSLSPTAGGVPASEWAGELIFGRELLVGTTGLYPLLVSPAGSSP